MGIDNVLRLVALPEFEERDRDHRRIRVLEINGRSILPELAEWQNSSEREWKTIHRKLRLIAENEELPKLGTIKRVGDGKLIIEIVADSARLFAFEEQDGDFTLICAGTFWITGGNKNRKQDKAIQEALALRSRWRKAQPVEGEVDIRVERIEGET